LINNKLIIIIKNTCFFELSSILQLFTILESKKKIKNGESFAIAWYPKYRIQGSKPKKK